VPLLASIPAIKAWPNLDRCTAGVKNRAAATRIRRRDGSAGVLGLPKFTRDRGLTWRLANCT
jgi:hypothetical protein